MAPFLLLITICCLIFQSPVLNLLAEQIEFLNSVCLSWIPLMEHNELPKSFVCGARLASPSLKQAFKTTALIHLVVISGAHLLVLEELLCSWKRLQKQTLLITFLLGVYVLFSGANPPATRSWVSLVLRWDNKKYKLGATPLLISLASGILTLLFQPQWITSLSFTLSWSASVSLAILRQFSPQSGLLQRQIFIYLIMGVPLLALGVPHPVTVFINIWVAPLLSHLLFPLSFIYLFIPSLLSPLFQGTENFIFFLSGLTPPPLATTKIPLEWAVIYPFCIHLFFIWQQRLRGTRRREKLTFEGF